MKFPNTYVIILIILAVAGIGYLAYNGSQLSVIGSTVISIDEAELRSSVPELNGPAWVLTLAQGGLGQTAFGSFSEQDVSAKTNDGAQPTKEFDLRIEYDEQQCVYPIEVRYNQDTVRKVDYKTWLCAFRPSEQDAINELRDQGINVNAQDIEGLAYGKSTVASCYAFYPTEDHVTGIMSRADLRTRADIILDVEGEPSQKLSIDSENSNQGRLGSIAYAIYTGNLDLGKSCEYSTTNPFTPVYRNGQWMLIDEGRYESFVRDRGMQASGLFQLEFRGNLYGTSSGGLENLKRDYNNFASQTLIPENFGRIDSSSNIASAVVRDDIKDVNQNPQITLFIKADALGIYTPAPKLEVVSGDSGCFKAGERGTLSVQVRNTGDEAGVWNAFAECSQPFDVIRSQTVSMDGGETETVYFDIRADTDTKLNGGCQITFQSPSQELTTSVNTCVDPQQVCQPSTSWCGLSGGSEAILTCNQAGSDTTVELCSNNQYCDASGNTPKCVDKDGTPGSSGGTDDDGQFNWLAFIGALVGGLVAGVWAYRLKALLPNNTAGNVLLWTAVILAFVGGFLLVALIINAVAAAITGIQGLFSFNIVSM